MHLTKTKSLIISLMLASSSVAIADTVASGDVRVTASFNFPITCSIDAAPVSFGEIEDTSVTHYFAESTVDVICKNLRENSLVRLNIDNAVPVEMQEGIAYMNQNIVLPDGLVQSGAVGIESVNGRQIFEYLSEYPQSKKVLTVPLSYHLKLRELDKSQDAMLDTDATSQDWGMLIPLSVSVSEKQ